MKLAARCADIPPGVEVSVAPCIAQTHYGWRVYTRMPDPETGKSRKVPLRRPDDGRPVAQQLEDLTLLRDGAKFEARKLRQARRQQAPRQAAPAASSLAADGTRYLGLETTKAMPSYETRVWEVAKWVEAFGTRPRHGPGALTATEMDEQLQRWFAEGYASSTVGKFRSALMALYTRLDGRSAANPVKDTQEWEASTMVAKGQPYDLLKRILAMIPDERGVAMDRPTLYREIWQHPMQTVASRYDVSGSYLSRVCRMLHIPRPPVGYWRSHRHGTVDPKRPRLPAATTAVRAAKVPQPLHARARLELMAFTGMEPRQLGRLTPRHISIDEQWYILPPRGKGARRSTPRAEVKKPMDSPEVREAFRRYVETGAWGEVDTSSLGRVWRRACTALEREEQKTRPHFKLPHMSQKVLRHSFGTQVFQDTHGNATVTAEMLGLAPGSPMVRRYTLGAVPSVLRTAMKNFRPKKRKRTRGAA
jgi:integrase